MMKKNIMYWENMRWGDKMLYDIKLTGPGKSNPVIYLNEKESFISFPYRTIGHLDNNSSLPKFFKRIKAGSESIEGFTITLDSVNPIEIKEIKDNNKNLTDVDFYLKGTFTWYPEVDKITLGKYTIGVQVPVIFERYYISPLILYKKTENCSVDLRDPNDPEASPDTREGWTLYNYYYSNLSCPIEEEQKKEHEIIATFEIEVTEESQETGFLNHSFLAKFDFPVSNFLTSSAIERNVNDYGENHDFFKNTSFDINPQEALAFNANDSSSNQGFKDYLQKQTYETDSKNDSLLYWEKTKECEYYKYKKWNTGRKGSFYLIYKILDTPTIVELNEEGVNSSFCEIPQNNLIFSEQAIGVEKQLFDEGEVEYYISIDNVESKKESFKLIKNANLDILYDSFFDISAEEIPTAFLFKDKNWYRYQVINKNEKEFIVYDSGQIYTSYIGYIPINLNVLLPSENYYVKIFMGDNYGNIFNFSSEEFFTIHHTKELNFLAREFKHFLSESFIKVELFELGIGKRLYPSHLLFPSKNIHPENFNYNSDWTDIKILRQNLSTKKSKWIATIKKPENFNPSKDKITIYDYSIKANQAYDYWAYIDEAEVFLGGSEDLPPIEEVPEDELTPVPLSKEEDLQNENILVGVKINDEPIVAEWDRWTLVTADKDPENEKVYHVDKVFTFEMNLSSGTMTNGTNITMSKNFTEFPVVQKDKSNFYSGSLTALMGVRKWGSTAEDFEQTPHMLEELRQLSTNYQPKFLKDRSGHLWRVEINGAIQVANTDNLATIDLKTMTVPWVQIGEADDISLIYTGTEIKEELYC